MEMRYFVGLDLGSAAEFTALALLERPQPTWRETPAQYRPAYRLRHLQRFPLATPYPSRNY